MIAQTTEGFDGSIKITPVNPALASRFQSLPFVGRVTEFRRWAAVFALEQRTNNTTESYEKENRSTQSPFGSVHRSGRNGVKIEKVEDYDYGRWAWIMDPEGNRIELWEPN